MGICYENQLSFLPALLHRQSVDLLLMPHSDPAPEPNIFFSNRSIDAYLESLAGIASHYATLLGVPAVLINKCGAWSTPLPGLPFLHQDSRFPGLSTIVDSDGTVKARLGEEEGVIVEDVTLDASRKAEHVPSLRGRWAVKVPWAVNWFPVVEWFGGLYYRRSDERKRRARKIASGG